MSSDILVDTGSAVARHQFITSTTLELMTNKPFETKSFIPSGTEKFIRH